jgi:ribosome-binding protein aMBF1 (putative translation factor)
MPFILKWDYPNIGLGISSLLGNGCDLANSLNDPRYRRIIDRLREARIEAGLTQAQLAGKLNHPQSFIAKIEGYERRLDVQEFVHLAEAVGVNPANLLKEAR